MLRVKCDYCALMHVHRVITVLLHLLPHFPALLAYMLQIPVNPFVQIVLATESALVLVPPRANVRLERRVRITPLARHASIHTKGVMVLLLALRVLPTRFRPCFP